MSIRSFSRANVTRRLFNTPLAVLPSTAAIVLGVVGPRYDVSQLLMHAGGERLDIGDLQGRAANARAGIEARRTADQRRPDLSAGDVLTVHDGVAHIDIRGELVAENGGGVTPSSGFTGYDAVAAAWGIAQRDTNVRGTIVDIDSPGGEVTDLMELVAKMMADRGTKPSRAIIRGVGASAAYAIAACCDEITVQDLGYAGSIGVITMHADFSGQLEQAGIKVTLIHAGAHKADGNPFAALPDDVRASIQADIDHAYGRFVAHVATARGLSEDVVRATEARVYRGAEAVNAGLADKVMGWADSQAEFVASVNGRQPAKPQRTRSSDNRASMETAMAGEPDNAPAAISGLAGITALTIVGSADHATALAAALSAAGATDLTVTAVDAAPEAASNTDAAAERTRVLALADLCPETVMSASLRTAIEDGATAGDFAIGLATAARIRVLHALAVEVEAPEICGETRQLRRCRPTGDGAERRLQRRGLGTRAELRLQPHIARVEAGCGPAGGEADRGGLVDDQRPDRLHRSERQNGDPAFQLVLHLASRILADLPVHDIAADVGATEPVGRGDVARLQHRVKRLVPIERRPRVRRRPLARGLRRLPPLEPRRRQGGARARPAPRGRARPLPERIARMSDNETPQIVVNPTPTLDQIAAAARTVVLVLGVLGALAGIISRRDWSAFILYMQSSDFLTAASAIAGFGAFAWGQWKTRHRAKQLATVAADPRVPDAVATLKAAA